MAVAGSLAGCAGGEKPLTPDAGTPLPPPAGAQPAAAPLPVALFLAREGKLEAVFRSLPVSAEEGPRAALEALIAGPTPVEVRQGFEPVLPPSATVRGVTIADGVAAADFSREIITRSADVGGGPQAESLALQAIYLTLAQFPDVERVKVLVEGQAEGTVEGRSIKGFWGHLGLPEYLEGTVAVLNVAQRQHVGDLDVARRAGGLRLKSLRWWAHPTLFRLVLEAEGVSGTPLAGIPPAEASFSTASRSLVLTVAPVKEGPLDVLSPGRAAEVNDWRVEKVAWEKATPCTFRLTLHQGRRYGWRLWGLTDPARIVLDVYATGSSTR
jgi:hypothetical protein